MWKIILVLGLAVQAVRLFAEEVQPARSGEIPEVQLRIPAKENRIHLGLSLGYPLGLTLGYKASERFEFDLFAGSHFNDFTAGVTALFTVLNINIEKERFPLSLGLSVYASFLETFNLEVLPIARLEYTFREVPMNLYVEAGPGLQMRFKTAGSADGLLHFTGTGALGLRFVF